MTKLDEWLDYVEDCSRCGGGSTCIVTDEIDRLERQLEYVENELEGLQAAYKRGHCPFCVGKP